MSVKTCPKCGTKLKRGGSWSPWYCDPCEDRALFGDEEQSVKITDEMVERALDGGLPWTGSRDHMRPFVRRALEAALNPKPAEPDQEHCWHSWCNLVLTGPFAGQRIRRCIHCQKTESTKPSACEHSWGGSTMHGDEVCCKCGDRRAPVAKPAEPEIPVSEGMTKAADEYLRTLWSCSNDALAKGVYRAMESQRRKEEGANHRFYGHRRYDDAGGPTIASMSHRRKSDP